MRFYSLVAYRDHIGAGLEEVRTLMPYDWIAAFVERARGVVFLAQYERRNRSRAAAKRRARLRRLDPGYRR
jgi:hypothetical protein